MGEIVVEGVGKAYKQYPTRWSRLAEWIGLGSRHELKWVLRDVSFRIGRGDAVGLIGMNGAGKSTLLKVISGTATASEGRLSCSGRLAALLELGMGFHPDFTGRQNAVLAAQLLGLSPDAIGRLLPEIEQFAEIGAYMDQPVRVYSSGMQMRLAFSVATAVRPEILIVDEALSVGDAYFQHKSFQRIRKYREEGTTLLLVSHDKQAILSICTRAILLSAGQVVKDGHPEAVLDYYNAMLASHQQQSLSQREGVDGKTRTTSGTGEASVVSITLFDGSGGQTDTVQVGDVIRLRFEVHVVEPIKRLVLGFSLKDRLGQFMYGTNTELTEQSVPDLPSGAALTYEATFQMRLGPGTYSVQTALVSTETHLVNNYEWRDLAMIFHVVNTKHRRFEGCNWLDASFQITRH